MARNSRATAAGLAAIGVGYLYFASVRILASTYAAPETTVSIPTDAASIERGHHLVLTRSRLPVRDLNLRRHT